MITLTTIEFSFRTRLPKTGRNNKIILMGEKTPLEKIGINQSFKIFIILCQK